MVKKLGIFGLFLIPILHSIGCFGGSPTLTTEAQSGFLANGAISLSRPVPQPFEAQTSAPILGFMPSESAEILPGRVRLDLATGTLSIYSPSGPVNLRGIELPNNLAAGKYKVVLKQEQPLWYAPDAYFQAREQTVPAQYNAARFRRGALGNKAIFLGESFAIHSGAASSPEVGGLRLSEEDLNKLYPLLDMGTEIEVS